MGLTATKRQSACQYVWEAEGVTLVITFILRLKVGRWLTDLLGVR